MLKSNKIVSARTLASSPVRQHAIVLIKRADKLEISNFVARGPGTNSEHGRYNRIQQASRWRKPKLSWKMADNNVISNNNNNCNE